jgi:hypothetical protein
VYLARAVHRLDPLKLLLAQIVIGTACFMVYSALFEPETTRWGAWSSSSCFRASCSPASTS